MSSNLILFYLGVDTSRKRQIDIKLYMFRHQSLKFVRPRQLREL